MSLSITERAEEAREVSFPVTGMTCASCVRRIEKALNRVEGVHEASVNLATEKARVVYDPGAADFEALTAAVEKAGYGVGHQPETLTARTEPPQPRDDEQDGERQREINELQRRWMVALPVGLGMMALMYIPLPLDAMDILMPALLVIATFVQFWAGKTFYTAAWAAAKHGSTNMNTLVALGTLVA
jgi:P-type Cu+ transporter